MTTASKPRKGSSKSKNSNRKPDKKNVVKNFVKAFISYIQLKNSSIDIAKICGIEDVQQIQKIKDEIVN